MANQQTFGPLPTSLLEQIIGHIVSIPEDNTETNSRDAVLNLFQTGALQSCQHLSRATLNWIRKNYLFVHVNLSYWSSSYHTDFRGPDLPCLNKGLVETFDQDQAQIIDFVLRDNPIRATEERRLTPAHEGQFQKHTRSSEIFLYSHRSMMKLLESIAEIDDVVRDTITTIRPTTKAVLEIEEDIFEETVAGKAVEEELMLFADSLNYRFDVQISEQLAQRQMRKRIVLERGLGKMKYER